MDVRALLLTDVVDSTSLVETLGDAEASRVWEAHDRLARDLLPAHDGLEIDKTDGFLFLFASVTDAVAYAGAYHRGLARLSEQLGIPLSARAGVHWGPVVLRENRPDDVARGAKPLEVEGIAKPTAARIMSVAVGGRTLGSRAAADQLDGSGVTAHSHGHWRMKGVAEPLELFELGADGPPIPPEDGAKVFRVVRVGDVWQPVRAIPNNLPVIRDSFVGRDADLAEIGRRLDQGVPILTLLGPGGTGKTRLSIELARRTLGDWTGGAWLVELELVHDEDGLLRALAKTLGVQLTGTDPAAWLAGVLRERGPTLLVLDNFEQLVHAAELVERLSELAPDTRWVVSSREALRIRGEHLLTVEPLALPDKRDAPENIRANPAVRLFLDRATAVAPGFVRSDADLVAVAELVRVLDGLPLALELAAARAKMLSATQLVERVSQRFRLLSGGRRGATNRQATLRGAIDWSWDLLEPWERHALAQCAVFQGGFSLEAAEAVLDLSEWPDAPWAEDAVQALLDKSLLRTWTPAVGGGERHELTEPLFGMYVSIHEYAAEKLADPEAIPVVQPRVTGPEASHALRARHARFYGGLSERLVEEQVNPRVLDLDRENLVAAFETAVAQGQPAVAAWTYRGLGYIADRLGPASLAAGRLHRFDVDALSDEVAYRCLLVERALVSRLGREAEYLDLSRRLVAVGERLGRLDIVLNARAGVVGRLGIRDVDVGALEAIRDEARAAGLEEIVVLVQHDLAVRTVGQESLDRFRELAALSGPVRVSALHNLGCALMGFDRPEETIPCAQEVLRVGAERGSPHLEMLGRANLGQAQAMLGHPEARQNLERALEVAAQVEEIRFLYGGSGVVLAILDARDGRLASARIRLDRSLPMLRALGDPHELAWGLAALARLRHAEGDAAGVAAAFAEIDALVPDWRTVITHTANWVRRMRAEIGG